MSINLKKLLAIFSALAVLASTVFATNLTVFAAGFTASEKTVSEYISLTPIKTFDDGPQNFVAGGIQKDGTTGAYSTVEAVNTLGYGISGASIKWSYDKSQEYWGSPYIIDGNKDWFNVTGDGIFMWIKSDVAGTVRLEGLSGDWSNKVCCDAEIEIGENLVFFPWSKFAKADGTVIAFSLIGYGLQLYPLTLPNTGTLYIDHISTYVDNTPEPEPTEFVASELRVSEYVTLTPVWNFDDGLQNFVAGGIQKDGTTEAFSTVEAEDMRGYGESGGSLKWTYNKSNEYWGSPYIIDNNKDWIGITGDGLFMWVKSEAAGKIRVEGLSGDWSNKICCDAEITVGENLVFLPWDQFAKADGTVIDFSFIGYGLQIYPLTLPNDGTLYIDHISTYVDNTPEPEPTDFTPSELRVPDDVKLSVSRDFDNGVQNFIGMGAQKEGTTGAYSTVESSAAFGYGDSGASLKWTYDKTQEAWASPSVEDESDTFFDADGDGFFMWIKSDVAGTVRLQGLANDWATNLCCDAEITAGENLVYFPYANFTKTDGSAAPDFTSVGYGVKLYALTLPNTGTLYIDSFGTYENIVPEPDTFTASTLNISDKTMLKVYNSFDDGLQGYSCGNAGANKDGSVAIHSGAFGLGTSGGSVKWAYNKKLADWASPSFGNFNSEFITAYGDGFFMWIKSEDAGTLRFEGILLDWATKVYCDVTIAKGENLVYFPYADFKINDGDFVNDAKAEFASIGNYSITVLSDFPNSGKMYIDSFGAYKNLTDEASIPGSTSVMMLPKDVILTEYESFKTGTNGFVGEAGGTGVNGSVAHFSNLFFYGNSFGSLRWSFDKNVTDYKIPVLINKNGTSYQATGYGYFMWMLADANGKLRLKGTDNNGNAVYCDADFVKGENLMYFPYASFKNANGTSAEFTSIKDISFTPDVQNESAVLRIDSFGAVRYVWDLTEDNTLNSEDIKSLRTVLIIGDTATKADINLDNATDVRDLVRIKKLSAKQVPGAESTCLSLALDGEWHPGVYGYDVTYTLKPVQNNEVVAVTYEASNSNVTFLGNQITIPSSVRQLGKTITVTATAENGETATLDIKCKSWSVTFEDEFEGTELDSTKWTDFEVGSGGGEVSATKKNNYTIADGKINLQVKRENWSINGQDFVYSQGAISTKDKFDQVGGLFTASVKIPTQEALNSAFWLLPSYGSHGTTAMGYQGTNGANYLGEVDILETNYWWGNKYSVGTHFFDQTIEGTSADKLNSPIVGDNRYSVGCDMSENYVEYSVAILDSGLYFYANGVLTYFDSDFSFNGGLDNDETGIPAYMILSLGVYKDDVYNWVGRYSELEKVADSEFPLSMSIDFAKAFK